MGKTAFSVNIGETVAIESGLPVAIFSMEMGGTQLAMRMLGSVGRLTLTSRAEGHDGASLTVAGGRMGPLRPAATAVR